MTSQNRQLLIEGLPAGLAVTLWHVTFSLLGLPAPMSTGLRTGSIIVLLGCFALCRGLMPLVSRYFIPPANVRENDSPDNPRLETTRSADTSGRVSRPRSSSALFRPRASRAQSHRPPR